MLGKRETCLLLLHLQRNSVQQDYCHSCTRYTYTRHPRLVHLLLGESVSSLLVTVLEKRYFQDYQDHLNLT